MKNLIITIIISSFFCIKSDLNSQENWEINAAFHHWFIFYETANNEAINPKYYGRPHQIDIPTWTIGAKRRLTEKVWMGIEFGIIDFEYTLELDRDFGDLDDFLNFSEPTLPGDDENIDKIVYENKYSRWGLFCEMDLFETGNKKFRITAGFGGELHRLEKSAFWASYRDAHNGISGLGGQGNNLATGQQKKEALDYYNSKILEDVGFFNIRIGTIFQFSDNLFINGHPTVSFASNSYQRDLLDMKPNFSINIGAGVRF